jgi:plastocyanin
MVRVVRASIAGLLLVGGLAACGGGSSSGGGSYVPPKGKVVDAVTVTSGNLYYKPKAVATKAGNVRITLVNAETGSHNLVIEGIPRFELQVNGKGSKDTNVVALEAGDYVFYCTLPGHRAAGMQGEIAVG